MNLSEKEHFSISAGQHFSKEEADVLKC